MNKHDLENKKQEWLDLEFEDEKSENTIKRYECAVNKFLKYIPDGVVTKATMINYKRHLIDTYSPKTVNNEIVIINKLVKYCESNIDDLSRLKRFDSKLAVKNIKVQEKSSIEDVITKEEYKRMLRMAKKKDEMDMYYIMRILGETGIRIGELKYFTIESLRKGPYITVRNKGKTRDIIVDTKLRRELISYAEDNGINEGKMFDVDYMSVYRGLKKVAGQCRGIKLSKIHPHAFRHLFATRFMEQIGDVTELKDILGHSSLDTTSIYSKSTKKQKKKHLDELWKNG